MSNDSKVTVRGNIAARVIIIAFALLMIAARTFIGSSQIGPWDSNMDANGHKVINLATPTAPADAVNKGYADSLILTGPTGATGAVGATGATGATGSAGSNGTNGATGATGSTGAAGSNGSAGADGATGATGSAGSNGSAGANGATGATGATGAGTDASTLATCVLTLTSDKSFTGGVPTDIAWDAASPNVGAMWASGTDVTIGTSGYYIIDLEVVEQTQAQIAALIFLNGSSIRVDVRYDNSQFGNSHANAYWEGLLTASDVVRGQAYGSAGNNPRDTEDGGTRMVVRRIY